MPVKLPQDVDPIAGFDDLLARAGVRDRTSIERHLAVCDAEPDPSHAKLWRRLAGKLGALAGLPVQTAGPQAVIFFVADGKYRMQVFALEDMRDGVLNIYLPDVMAQAVKQKIVVKTGKVYNLTGKGKEVLRAELMDATNTSDPPPYVKNMIGWNRKAVRITLDTTESNGPLVLAAEAICALASKNWAAAAAPAASK